MRVAVIGLGKIGLPLAVQIAGKGFETSGVDLSTDVLDSVRRGIPHFPGEPGLEERLGRVVAEGLLTVGSDTPDAVASADTVIVVVPLIVDPAGSPDFGSIDAATRGIAEGLHEGQLVSYETTLPVGTTRRRFAPALESASGLRVGEDFHLVHSPERVSSGRVFRDLTRYPKLVGGITPGCAAAGTAFYESVLDFDERPDLARPNGAWDLGSAEAAELAKLAETTYRDVNIALANEFAVFAESEGLDVHAVIAAANSQPYSHIHRPGVAVGGHCIPVYPRFYLSGHPDARLPAAARSVNESMPGHAAELAARALGGLGDRRVLIMGAAYRGGVKEATFSGVFPLARAIEERGGIAVVHDPLFTDSELTALGLTPHDPTDPVDAAILQADHEEYRSWTAANLPACGVIVDGRGILDPAAWPGVDLITLGRG